MSQDAPPGRLFVPNPCRSTLLQFFVSGEGIVCLNQSMLSQCCLCCQGGSIAYDHPCAESTVKPIFPLAYKFTRILGIPFIEERLSRGYVHSPSSSRGVLG